MVSGNSKTLEPEDQPSSSSSSASSGSWTERIFVPTILAGIVGGGVGLLSKHRKALGLSNIAATYATNFSIVTGCYCVTREFVIETRKTDPDDLVSSAIAGFFSGAILGRLQSGPIGAAKYSAMFAIVGTALDYSTIKLRSGLRDYLESMSEDEKKNYFELPDWSPIKVLNEEELAEKEARKEKLYAQSSLAKLTKEES